MFQASFAVKFMVNIIQFERDAVMARKGENIYKRKDGRWEGRYIAAYGADGKAKYAYVYARSYSEVKKKLSARKSGCIEKAANGSLNKKSFGSWCDEWIETKRQTVKASTFIRYRNMLDNHILPELGDVPITSISTALMSQFVQDGLANGRLDGKGGLSTKSMTDILVIAKDIFRYAQNSGVQTICNFKQIPMKRISHEMRVLSRLEEQRLISVLLNDMDRCKLGVYICLFTGLRIGELCALQWKNISFSEKTLKVEHTMQRLQVEDAHSEEKTRIIITEPKSCSSARVIPLPDFLLDILRPFAGAPNSFILSGERSEYIEPRTMQNRFKKYLREGQIREANFHSLRHTFATRCVELGFDVKTLSEILGHSSVKITLDRYVHSSMEQKMMHMEKLSCIA